MKTLFLIMCFILHWNLVVVAQPAIEWQRCLGGSSQDVPGNLQPSIDILQQTPDSGFIFVAKTSSNDGDVSGHHGLVAPDYWVVKTDRAGNIEWQRCLGGTSSEFPSSVQTTADGGYIVSGTTFSNDGDVTNFWGSSDYWVVKLSATGILEWQKCLGSSFIPGISTGYDRAFSAKQTTDGGYCVIGRSNSNNGDVSGHHGGGSDYWVVKLNSSGNIQWQKCLGGSKGDEARSFILTNDGGFVIAGSSRSNNGNVSGNHDANGNSDDIWLVKTDSLGNIAWQKCIGGTDDDIPHSVSSTADGGYIIAAVTSSDDGDVVGYNAQYSQAWIIKTDSVGNIEKQKLLGGQANSVFQTLDGGYLVSGNVAASDSDQVLFPQVVYYWLVKLDSALNVLWHSSDGPENGGYCASAIETAEGDYVFIGSAYNNGGVVSGAYGGLGDVWLVKMSQLHVEKTKMREICSLCNGMISVSVTGGTAPYSFVWNNGATSSSATSLCEGVYVVTITDAAGRTAFCSDFIINDTVTVFTSQTPASCWSCPDGSASLLPYGGSGVYSYSWPGFPDTTPTLTGLPHGWVYGCVTDSMGCMTCDSIEVLSPVGLNDFSDEFNILSTYPNPASTELHLVLPANFEKQFTVQIYSLHGELIVMKENTAVVNISSLPAGPFLVVVTNGAGNRHKTIAVKSHRE